MLCLGRVAFREALQDGQTRLKRRAGNKSKKSIQFVHRTLKGIFWATISLIVVFLQKSPGLKRRTLGGEGEEGKVRRGCRGERERGK
jgi:hypothetical protein